ncbi:MULTISPECIES: DUF4231 domain-containing protein [unclassified Kribbella]|uniref:DUF4231 domain-containing protein n=1 Tax=unclassified Kribbella TaxID=2644121 RepID=UPI0030199ECB
MLTPNLSIKTDDLPGLHDAANSASIEGQHQFIRASMIKLGLAAAAAIVSAFIGSGGVSDYLAYLVAVLFIGVLCAEAWIWAQKPEDTWYDGRALAESSKTMAWRFTVGAAPYSKSDASSEQRFVQDLRNLLDDGPQTDIHPSDKPVISEQMREVRRQDLAERQAIYIRDRIDDQIGWYKKKADISRRRSNQWRMALIAAEGVGIFAAFSRASGGTDLDLAGIVAAFVGAGAAWLSIRQHDGLRRAYTYANQELSMVRNSLESCGDDSEWEQLVADAEEAISREHTMWRASRSTTLG